jgi:SAM-dependent methyltransferase
MGFVVSGQVAVLNRLYPEVGAGGFTRVDGTVAFYGRINALLKPNMTVVDFGAGRGAGPSDDPVPYRRSLQTLRGRVREVIGVDIDPVVKDNPAVDRAIVTSAIGALPLDDESVDLVVSDYCFEHVDRPDVVSGELDRVLKTGGWICARTPNRWGYIAVSARLVPNRWHVRALRALQPGRQAADVFPTRYCLNTVRDLKRWFPVERFLHCGYGHSGPPAYFGSSVLATRAARAALRYLPESLSPLLLVFMQKTGQAPASQ